MSEQRIQTIKIVWQGDEAKGKAIELTRAISDVDNTVEQLNSVMGDNVTIETKVATSKAELTQQMRKEYTQATRLVTQYNKMTSSLQEQIAMTSMSSDEQEVYANVMALGVNASQKMRDEVVLLTTQLQAQRTAAGNSATSWRKFRGVMQNAGWQMQDTIVQFQMGTDAMMILSQQGSQFAAAFGPTGAVVGAVVALAGALAGSLLPSLFETDDAIEDLTERLQTLADMGELVQEQSEYLVTQSEKEIEAKQSQIAALEEQNWRLSAYIDTYDEYQNRINSGIKLTEDEQAAYDYLGSTIDDNRDKLEENIAAIVTLNQEIEDETKNIDAYGLSIKTAFIDMETWSNYALYGMGVGMDESQVKMEELRAKADDMSSSVQASFIDMETWSNYSLYGLGTGMAEAAEKMAEMEVAAQQAAAKAKEAAAKEAAAVQKAEQKQALADDQAFYNDVLALKDAHEAEMEQLESDVQTMRFELDPNAAALDDVLSQTETLSDALDAQLISEEEFQSLYCGMGSILWSL